MGPGLRSMEVVIENKKQSEPTTEEPTGLLALVGSWADVPDEEIDQFLRDIYQSRAEDLGRPVPPEWFENWLV
jgi:hypothetical protein